MESGTDTDTDTDTDLGTDTDKTHLRLLSAPWVRPGVAFWVRPLLWVCSAAVGRATRGCGGVDGG